MYLRRRFKLSASVRKCVGIAAATRRKYLYGARVAPSPKEERVIALIPRVYFVYNGFLGENVEELHNLTLHSTFRNEGSATTQRWANSARNQQKSVNFDQKWPGIAPNLPDFSQIRPDMGPSGPTLARSRHNMARSRHDLGRMRPDSAKLSRLRPKMAQTCYIRRSSTKFNSKSTTLCQTRR